MNDISGSTQNRSTANREQVVEVQPGWRMLPLVIATLLGGFGLFIYSVAQGARDQGHPIWVLFVAGLLLIPCSALMFAGFFTLQPNEARVLVLFGEYRGTVRKSGYFWGNPFYSNSAGQSGLVARAMQFQAELGAAKGTGTATLPNKRLSRFRVSLRTRNFNCERLKVNDKRGNPIEIAAVVVWRVQDTAQAMFDVEDMENYVRVQSESALRHLASVYAYDHGEENEVTLRSGVEEVSQALRQELQARLDKAGVLVEEARLTHLAYAPEIAQAMLRRQQAEAVIAARQKIVHGAVSMVDMALRELAEKQVVQLDDERRAAMVSNLMVVLCGEAEVHPVINTGTLYS
jgi:regulator of protease activity HflC (stomatin/prohibitin superfamily)